MPKILEDIAKMFDVEFDDELEVSTYLDMNNSIVRRPLLTINIPVAKEIPILSANTSPIIR